MMRLVYLPANQAWVFTFGGDLLRLENEDYFYGTRESAVVAADFKRLKVSRSGVVSAKDETPGW